MDEDFRVVFLHSADDVSEDREAGGVIPVMENRMQVVRTRPWIHVSMFGISICCGDKPCTGCLVKMLCLILSKTALLGFGS